MPKELIQKVYEAETAAAHREKDAQAEMKRIISQAKANAQRQYEVLVSEARAAAAEAVVQAQLAAEAEAAVTARDIEADCERIRSDSMKNLDKAVEIIVAEVVK